MPVKPRIPKLCKHRRSGLGYVTLEGRQIYLGPYDAPDTRQKYDALIGQWLANGRALPGSAAPASGPDALTIFELTDHYYRERVRGHYCRDTELRHKLAIRTLNTLFGPEPAAEFGPRKLRMLRDHWIQQDLARTTVNGLVQSVKLCFRWAVSMELAPATVHHSLSALEGLKKGRGNAREPEPRTPVAEADVKTVADMAPSPLRTLIWVQWHTGARSGELVGLRKCDIDTSQNPWRIELAHHKTAHHGKRRVIYLGPNAQAALRPLLIGKRDGDTLFDPRDAVAERDAPKDSRRRPGQAASPRQTGRRVGACYTVASYRRAVTRLCDAAGIPRWFPHQLRHAAATRVRDQYGLEAAQIALGHAWADVTQLYAHVDEAKASELAVKIG